MYNNRHCIEKDLIQITTLIKRFVSYLDNENIEAMSFAITLEKEIENFDVISLEDSTPLLQTQKSLMATKLLFI